MNRFTLIFGVAGLILATSCSDGNKKKTWEVTVEKTADADDGESYSAQIKSENGLPMLLDFYADWCGPCKRLAPILEAMEEDYKDRVEFRRINVDDNQDLAAAFGVESIPTLVYLNSEGNEVTRTVGLVGVADIERTLHSLLKNSSRKS